MATGHQARHPGALRTIIGSFAGGLAGCRSPLGARCSATLSTRPPSTSSSSPTPSFKAARTLSRDQVTSFIREPFVEGQAGAVDWEEPVRTGGMEQAIGELVTCTRCVGTWAAAGLATTQILAPRFGRLLTWSLRRDAASDLAPGRFHRGGGANGPSHPPDRLRKRCVRPRALSAGGGQACRLTALPQTRSARGACPYAQHRPGCNEAKGQRDPRAWWRRP